MSAPRVAHPFFMHDAIYAQPGALRLVTRGNDAALDGAAAALLRATRVVVAGIGSSLHVALIAERLLAGAGRLAPRVRAVPAFDLVAYGPPLDAETVVIVVSHSGTNRFVKDTLARANQAGAPSITVTGKGRDGLAGADFVLRTVELEVSSTHTASYTTALALLAHLAARLGADADFVHELGEVPDDVATLLGQEPWEDLAGKYGNRTRCWFVGGGANAAAAAEGALKLQEAAYATALASDAEQFLHGPWAACEADDLVIVVAPAGPVHDRVVMAARAARAVGAAVIAIGADDDRELAAAATETIALPAVPELLSPILAVVPLQLFAYHASLARGANPDTMRTHVPAYGRARASMQL
jgi:glucosamine--fructose-6-phosphate aminotransferase (isomerizing)